MGITQNLLNMDAYFRSTPGDKIILSDLNYYDIEDNERLERILISIYGNDETISTKPSCDCGKLNGKYMLDKYCSSCGTKCIEPHDKVYPVLWLKALDENYKFLNPIVWLMVVKILDVKLDYLRYFCDTRYNPNVKIPDHIVHIKNFLNGQRDYVNTMSNLRNIILYLTTLSKFKNAQKLGEIHNLLKIMDEHTDCLFSTYLPIINKKLFVIEETTKGRFVNLISSDIVDVTKTWMKLSSNTNITPKTLSNNMGVVMSNLSKLYSNYIDQYLVKKGGMFRRHVYGARSHFTFRTVITSVPGKHAYDEIVPPWCVGVSVLRPHILNKLIRKGYTFKEANKILYRCVKKYDQVVSDILDELIMECPYKGIPVLFTRNPELKQGSTQRMYIIRFGKDPAIMSTEFSALAAKAPNADYDGDEMNAVLLLDNDLTQECSTMDSHFVIPHESKPYAISGFLGLLSPSTSILSNYIYSDEPLQGEDKIVKKMNFTEI